MSRGTTSNIKEMFISKQVMIFLPSPLRQVNFIFFYDVVIKAIRSELDDDDDGNYKTRITAHTTVSWHTDFISSSIPLPFTIFLELSCCCNSTVEIISRETCELRRSLVSGSNNKFVHSRGNLSFVRKQKKNKMTWRRVQLSLTILRHFRDAMASKRSAHPWNFKVFNWNWIQTFSDDSITVSYAKLSSSSASVTTWWKSSSKEPVMMENPINLLIKFSDKKIKLGNFSLQSGTDRMFSLRIMIQSISHHMKQLFSTFSSPRSR